MTEASRRMDLVAARPDQALPARSQPVDLAAIAQMLIDQRDTRSAYLPKVLNEDPQWLMILNLFIAGEKGTEMRVSHLCSSAGVPSTTALRHIQWLQEKQVVIRYRHPRDARSYCLALHPNAHQQVMSYLLSVALMTT